MLPETKGIPDASHSLTIRKVKVHPAPSSFLDLGNLTISEGFWVPQHNVLGSDGLVLGLFRFCVDFGLDSWLFRKKSGTFPSSPTFPCPH